ncbi:MAG TPA: hypothetical protein VN621_04270 [Arthrobacter sp.]|nr:hypothetical protein [Arthrobacter sp.]
MVAAAVLACLAVAGSSVDRLAHTAGPVRQIAGDLPGDPAVRAALPPAAAHAVVSAVPAGIFIPDALRAPLERASERAVKAALDSPGFEEAWLASVDASRRGYVERLEQVRAGTRDVAPAVLELGPLASLAADGLQSAADDAGLGFLLGALPTDITASVPLALPGTGPEASARTATAVSLSSSWAWAALGAILLALAGLALARPRNRGWVVVLGGLVVCLGAMGLLAVATAIDPDTVSVAGRRGPAAALGDVVTARVLNGLSGYVGAAAVPTLVGGAVAVVVGGVMRLLVGRSPNR